MGCDRKITVSKRRLGVVEILLTKSMEFLYNSNLSFKCWIHYATDLNSHRDLHNGRIALIHYIVLVSQISIEVI